MKYIDTHVHLNDEMLYSSIDSVISDATSCGVSRLFVVGFDIDSSKRALEIAKKYDNVYAIIGFHPCNIRGYKEEEYAWLEANAKDDKVVAIGEIGYDLHWDDTTLEEQTEAFIKQLDIACRLNKPVSIHSREASQLTYDLISKYKGKLVGGVLHSYSGSYELALLYTKLNFVFGISGPVTFKNGKNIVDVVSKLDVKYLISETDSPYLTPTPYRGQCNYPKYIPLIVSKIASIKNMPESEVVDAINKNVLRIFNV